MMLLLTDFFYPLNKRTKLLLTDVTIMSVMTVVKKTRISRDTKTFDFALRVVFVSRCPRHQNDPKGRVLVTTQKYS